jgi:hypothetical protein
MRGRAVVVTAALWLAAALILAAARLW